MKQLLFIGLGSGVGGMLRYSCALWLQSKGNTGFPWATFFVNLVGSFLIGCVFSLFNKELISNDVRLFLATGLIGGFTTFSAFSYECLEMIRMQQWTLCIIYILASIVCGLGLAFLGFSLFK